MAIPQRETEDGIDTMSHEEAEHSPRHKASRAWWGWLLVVAILVAIGAIGYLLTLTYLAQKRLQLSARTNIEEDLSERAIDLFTFLQERKDDVHNLAVSTVVESYFLDHSRGISEEYGLKTSQKLILKLFEQQNQSDSPGWHNNFARLVLFSADGKEQVSYQSNPPFRIQTWDWSTVASTGLHQKPQVLIDPTNPDFFLFLAPVKGPDTVVGYIAGWIPVAAIQNHYFLTEEHEKADGQRLSGTILMVINKDFWFGQNNIPESLKQRLSTKLAAASWNKFDYDPQETKAERTHFFVEQLPDLQTDYIVFASRLPDDDMLVLRLWEQQSIMDPQGPLRLVLSFGLVGTAIIGILWLAVRQQTKAKLLESRLEETRRQQQQVREANRNLRLEVMLRRKVEEEAEQERQRLELVVYATAVGVWEWSLQSREATYNDRWAEISGHTLTELEPLNMATWENLCHPEDLARSEHLLHQHLAGETGIYDCECRIRHKQGLWIWVHIRGRVVDNDNDGTPTKMSGTLSDISRRKLAELELIAAKNTLEHRVEERTRDLAAANAQMVMREKMASIGQLAAGIAHEINNPINFVRTNFATLTDNFSDLSTLLAQYRSALSDPEAELNGEVRATMLKAAEDLNLDFLLDDIPELFRETERGFVRIGKIIQAMRDFSRTQFGDNYSRANINKGIEDTLTIARNEYRYHADVETDYGDIPEIMCVPEQLNQVFLNLVVNSSHAIAEANKGRGTIRISTRRVGGEVVCRFWDNGVPIPDNIKDRLFEPFFTTKPPGQGTGLGLSISYDIVVQKHRGTIFIETPEEGGKAFVIRLPIDRKEEE